MRGPVEDLLLAALPARGSDGVAATVLDCGGGSGSYAVPLAVAGAAVTVVDISADALATLHRRASEAGVGARVTPVQGDAELLTEAVGESEFDLVLAHGILEAVDKPAVAFAGICRALSPGGLLSVLVTNPVATVLARALAGDLRGALAEFRELDVPPARPGRVLVRELCAEHGLVIEQVHGVGVFTEWIPGAALDAPGARDALADLEKLAAVRAPFAEIATRLHLLARRPRGAS